MLIGISTGTIYGLIISVTLIHIVLRYMSHKGFLEIPKKILVWLAVFNVLLAIAGLWQVYLHISNTQLKHSKTTLKSNTYYEIPPPTGLTINATTLEEKIEFNRKKRLERLEETTKLK